jgi:hypothetical protein
MLRRKNEWTGEGPNENNEGFERIHRSEPPGRPIEMSVLIWDW